jgi:cell volume regulation protein A
LVDYVSVALIISSLIIFIGFLANHLFNKTGFPDMLILIALGVLFGPVLGVFDPASVKTFAPYIAALALAYIIFDGGMGLNIRSALLNSPKAVLLAVLGFVFSLLGTAAFVMFVFNMPLLYGLLFGAIFGGSSSVIVVSLATKIKISDKSATILILESAITDIFSIVIALAIIDILVTGQASIPAIGLGIAGKFLIGALIGVGLGFAWLFALKKCSNLPFSYMLTLGVVLLGYAASEAVGGSGVLSVLLFGLILGNESEVRKFFRQNLEVAPSNEKLTLSVSKGLKRFEAEVAFLISTFFFVFLGIIASVPSPVVLVSGIVLSIIMLVTRYAAVWLTTLKSPLKKERGIMTAILTRGLATAVLATLPGQLGLDYADIFVDVALVVIIVTAIMATVGAAVISRKEQVRVKGLVVPPETLSSKSD